MRAARAPLLLALVLWGGAWAAPPPAPPPPPSVDDEFLEFLGSVDGDSVQPEDLWLVDYWTKPGTGKAPPHPAPPGAAKPAPAPKPGPPAGTQNNG